MHLSVSYHTTCRQLLSPLDSLQLENCGSETARILIRLEHFTSLMCSSLPWLTPRCRRPVCHGFRVCVDADLCDLCVCVCVCKLLHCSGCLSWQNKHKTEVSRTHWQLCSVATLTVLPLQNRAAVAADLHEVKLRHLTNGRCHSSLLQKNSDSAGFAAANRCQRERPTAELKPDWTSAISCICLILSGFFFSLCRKL